MTRHAHMCAGTHVHAHVHWVYMTVIKTVFDNENFTLLEHIFLKQTFSKSIFFFQKHEMILTSSRTSKKNLKNHNLVVY